MARKKQESPRCTFTFRDGRRCRMLQSPGRLTFCPHHYRQYLKEEGVSVSERLAATGALDNLWSIRRALKHTVRDVATGRLTPEAARALTGLARMLLDNTRSTDKPGKEAV